MGKALTTPATPRKRTTVAKGYTKKHHYGSLDGEVGYVDDEVCAMYSTDLQYTEVMYNTIQNYSTSKYFDGKTT